MSKKQKRSKKALAEFIFWLHTIILLLVLVSGLFIAWQWVLIILVLIKLQQFALHGCFLTILELKEEGSRRRHYYYQLAARRFAGARLNRRGVRIVSAVHVGLSLAIALLASYYNLRIHI